MKFTEIPADTFKEIQLNAGVLLSEFDPKTGTLSASNILGATTGGVAFASTPTFTDYGEDIDNCPKNTMELKRLDSWEVTLSGTYITMTPKLAKSLVACGSIDASDATKIVPRNDVDLADFENVWWVGDYSAENGATNGGYIAIHLLNALSTGGFATQSTDKGKGQFAFTYTAHYSMDAQDVVPFELYVKEGTAEASTSNQSTKSDKAAA